jgi:Uma2 family endonuclease
MMAEAARREDWPRSVTEFEAWHARQPERWEFIGGEPRLMAPGSLSQTIIKGNLFSALREAFEGSDCHVLVDGAQIVTDEISAIPDLIVTCSGLDLSTPAVAEPTIIVEVMSPWSEVDDTHRKWFSHRKIASLKHYLVVAQDRRVVQLHSRAGELWRERFVTEGVLELDDPPVRLHLDAVYAQTDVAA